MVDLWLRYPLVDVLQLYLVAMIKIFKGIRQQLLTENKFSKYLLYAIGEIILVVIGILIALSINNWNEAGKNRLLEQSYLINLMDEFRSNKNSLIDVKNRDSTELVMGEMLMDFHQFEKFDGDTLNVAEAIEWLGFTRNFTFKRDVWNDIYSTGNSLIFQNSELQKSISEFYSFTHGYEVLIRDLNEYHKSFRKANKGVINPHHRVEWVKRYIENDTISNYEYPVESTLVLTKFRSNEETSSILADQIMVTMVSIKQIEYLTKTYIDPILYQIELEIEKLE